MPQFDFDSLPGIKKERNGPSSNPKYPYLEGIDIEGLAYAHSGGVTHNLDQANVVAELKTPRGKEFIRDITEGTGFDGGTLTMDWNTWFDTFLGEELGPQSNQETARRIVEQNDYGFVTPKDFWRAYLDGDYNEDITDLGGSIVAELGMAWLLGGSGKAILTASGVITPIVLTDIVGDVLEWGGTAAGYAAAKAYLSAEHLYKSVFD